VFWSASPDLLVVASGVALPFGEAVPLLLVFTSGAGAAFGFGTGVVCCCVGFTFPLLFVLLGVVLGVVCAAANAPSANNNTDSAKNFFMV